jgi:adenine-specific DNA-methyltransferase
MTWWDKKEYSSTAYGTNLVKDIFGELQVFSYPKSLFAVIDCLKVLSSKKDMIVLDIFGGSGTTMHAIMQMNNEDGGSRQAILASNNENNICEEVTYERNKRIIQGYTNAKKNNIEGLINNNLRYYKTETIGRETSLRNKRDLTKLATELLCIKENCYTEQKIKLKQSKLFFNKNVTLLILFDDHIIPEAIDLIKSMDTKLIKVYVFSMGSDPYTEDFAEVLDKVTLCALPDAIYKAYQNVLPNKRRSIPIVEEFQEISTNENGEQLSLL